MKYRSFIIKYVPALDAYECWQDSTIEKVREYTQFYADTVEEAKEEIDEMMDFDPSDV